MSDDALSFWENLYIIDLHGVPFGFMALDDDPVCPGGEDDRLVNLLPFPRGRWHGKTGGGSVAHGGRKGDRVLLAAGIMDAKRRAAACSPIHAEGEAAAAASQILDITQRMARFAHAGYVVEELRVRANGRRGGARQVIWIGTKR